MASFPENLPRWEQRQKTRQRLQQISGTMLLGVSAGGSVYWWGRLSVLAAVLLAAAPLGLWLLLDCPPRREQRPEELAVFNRDKAAEGSLFLLALVLFFWLVTPGKLTEAGGDLQKEEWLVFALWHFLCMGLMAYILVAFRNEVLFFAPDGSTECWDILGRHHVVEKRPAAVRLRPRLGRCYVCDETGRVLYHVDRGMINVDVLLDWLQAQGVANIDAETRRLMTTLRVKVLTTLDWDEAERTPAHRWIAWLRPVAWLPPVLLLVQWWLLVRGLAVLGLCPASVAACWLPVLFIGAYLACPQIFVWRRYPTKPRPGGRWQILATPAWRKMHVNLALTVLPACGALLWAIAESQVFLVANTGRMAVLCVILGLLLAVLCEMRCPRERKRERRKFLLLAVLLAFPLGFSLNLALTAPAHPDTGVVVEALPPEEGQDYSSLVFLWEGQEIHSTQYEELDELPQPGEPVDLCVRESLLGIPLVSVC